MEETSGATGAVNDVNTYWRHIFCDNEPEHVQAFRNGVDGSFGPAAGERCEGCGRPTDVEHDWVQIVPEPVNVCDTCSMPAVEIDGVWRHAEAKDDVFHAVFFGGAR